MRKKTATGAIPECNHCKRSEGVQFKIFGSAYPFGDICVQCEDTVTPALLEASNFLAAHVQVIPVRI